MQGLMLVVKITVEYYAWNVKEKGMELCDMGQRVWKYLLSTKLG
jgi:hypothetical protein